MAALVRRPSETRLRPGKSPIALRVRLSDGSGFDLTEAGTKKSARGIHRLVPALGGAGHRPAGTGPAGGGVLAQAPAEIAASAPEQLKGVLRDQSIIAGVGNAYSDEILHVAQLSPFAMAAKLDDGQTERLYAALRDTLSAAVGAATGKPAAQLKDAKRQGMRVHGRTGETCPECGDVVREVSFADSSLQYCATCQTGGKPLADRRTSKFLK